MLQQMFEKYPWTISMVGVILFVLSPIIVPLMLVWEHWDEVAAYYKDCYDAVFNRPKV